MTDHRWTLVRHRGTPWASVVDTDLESVHDQALRIDLVPATPETRLGRRTTPARPAHARINGPLGGARNVTADDLRREASRLLYAADRLDEEPATTLF